MSVVMANALGTGIFCGLWQGIGSVLGLATWMGFVGCTSYFSAGCGKTGFIKSMCSNYVGLLWGMCIIMSGNINSGILFGAIVTGAFSWLICYQSKIDLLSLVPNTFMGGFSALPVAEIGKCFASVLSQEIFSVYAAIILEDFWQQNLVKIIN